MSYSAYEPDRTNKFNLQPLSRYGGIKNDILPKDRHAAVKASWHRLLPQLEKKMNEIGEKGPEFIPEVQWSSLVENGKLPAETEKSFKETGCLIVRGVVPDKEARALKNSLQDYIDNHPRLSNKIFQECHWSKCQTRARSHPNITRLMQIVGQAWQIEDPDNAAVDLDTNVVYSDRSRIRPPGKAVTLDLHQDSGSAERWEDTLYRDVYREIFEGRWEDWDPWIMDRRLQGSQDLYGDLGVKGSVCTSFRSLQGWLALSENSAGEGTIKFLPNLKETIPYLMLRSFFNDENEIVTDNTFFPGVTPGSGQFYAPDDLFPLLKQKQSVVSIPWVKPGDFVFWHADVLHEVDKMHNGKTDSSVVYIGHCPLSNYNIKTLEDTAECFLSGNKPKDFTYINDQIGFTCESDFPDRSTMEDVLSSEGRQALGLEPFDVSDPSLKPGARKIRELANKKLAQFHGKTPRIIE